MNFFVVYSMALIMVATISRANQVKKALEGATEVSVGYSLEVQVPIQGGQNRNVVITGSISVSPRTVVEYCNEVGFIVTAMELLEGINDAEKQEFPNLGGENIHRLKSIHSVELKGKNPSAPSKKLFRSGLSYAKDVYLLDISNVTGAVEFETYDFEANHKSEKKLTIPGTTKIVRHEGKLYAQIYFPYAVEDYTFKLPFQIEGGVNFQTKVSKSSSIGLIVIGMADD